MALFVFSVCSVMTGCTACTDADSNGIADTCSACSGSYVVAADGSGCVRKYSCKKIKRNCSQQTWSIHPFWTNVNIWSRYLVWGRRNMNMMVIKAAAIVSGRTPVHTKHLYNICTMLNKCFCLLGVHYRRSMYLHNTTEWQTQIQCSLCLIVRWLLNDNKSSKSFI